MIGYHIFLTTIILLIIPNLLVQLAIGQCQWDIQNNNTICQLRNIESTGLDLQPAEIGKNLKLLCSENLMYDSELPKNVFNRLNKLEVLIIDSCKIIQFHGNTFNGLTGLKVLSIHTHNNEWNIGRSLEFKEKSLNGLQQLEILNLSDNNLRTLPSGIFCNLSALQVLNLTHNRIRSTDNIGFHRKQCNNEGEFRLFDISHNELSTIPDNWGVTRLRRLQQLNLQHNNITDISGDALAGLTSLRIFNISYNNLEQIPATLFVGTKDLQEIHLQFNKLYELPRGLFHRLEQLLILDLSGNQLSSHSIDNSTFAGLIRLIVLNLADNAITRIDSKTFKDLYFLQILDLRNNSIGYIDDNTFLPLYNLHTLNLAENRLHTINNELFNGLYVLSKLTLNNNLIGVIEQSAFKNCSDLKELDLSSNRLSDIPIAIHNLSMLNTLDLGENQIHIVPNNSFNNLNSLTGLRLIDNQIGNITIGMFNDLPRLEVLNLARNRIQNIERGSFDGNPALEALRLDENFLSDINGVFATLSSLLWLNLAENHLVWFDYAFIPSKLKWLDIHSNYIELLGNYYKLQEEISVKTLDCSHNRILEIGPMSIPNSVELVFINDNLISAIHPNTFVDKQNLTRVDLYSNALTKLHLHTLRLPPVPIERPLPEFYLAGNPFECDCQMDWLPMINNLTTRQHPRIMDLNGIQCMMPHARGQPVRALTTLKTNEFLCKYQAHCLTLCQCCDLDICDCEMICPNNCTCYHDQTWQTNVVDCSGQQFNEIPRRVPIKSTSLYLDGNVFQELKTDMFIGRKGLNELYLNNSQVSKIRKRAFVELQSLEILHLEDNRLRTLNGYEFDGLTQIRELYLQNNQIDNILNGTFSTLRFLQILRIDGNRLVSLHMEQFQLTSFPELHSLAMGRNSWTCRCQFLVQLTAFVAKNGMIIDDIQDIYCIEGIVKHELELNSTTDCNSIYDERTLLPTLIINEHIPLLMAAAILIILFILFVLIIVFREPLRLWLFAKCGVRMCESPPEDYEKLYDALFLYSEKDYEIVSRDLAADLELNRPSPLRLCLQHRDLSRDATYLQILETARASKRVVIFLSRNFLQTEWSRYEIRNALHEAIKDRPQKLVIIEEVEAIIEAEGDVELLPFIKSRFVNHIKISDKHFWEKLRYALPAEIQQRCNNYTLHQHERFPQSTSNNTEFCMQQQQQHFQQNLPPAYYQQQIQQHVQQSGGSTNHPNPETDDANYSSATTATPSPHANRRIIEPIHMSNQQQQQQQQQRPPSEHIYFSIDSDYNNGMITGELNPNGPIQFQQMQNAPAWATAPTLRTLHQPHQQTHKTNNGQSFMV